MLFYAYCHVAIAQSETDDFFKSLDEFNKLMDAKDNGKQDSAQLVRVSRLGDLNFVALLLNNGADVNATDDTGTTPLMAASEAGKFEVARLLLGRRANVSAKDKLGETALVKSIMNGRVHITALLAAWMPKTELEGLSGLSKRLGNAQIMRVLTGSKKPNSQLTDSIKGTWSYNTRDLHALMRNMLGEERYKAQKAQIEMQSSRIAHDLGKSRFEIVPGAGNIFILETKERGSHEIETFLIKEESSAEAIVENVKTGEQLRIISTSVSTMSISSTQSNMRMLLKKFNK